VFKRQTWTFHFSTYRPNSLNIYLITRRFDRMRESTATIVASVVETARRPGSSSSTTLSRPWANVLHQTCIAGLVKYLSPYTGRISDWMAFALSHFAHSKRITEGCSLWDDFNGNVAISNVYKWRHSDAIVIKLISRTHNKIPYKMQNAYFGIFIVWKLTEWRRFVTYLWNDPRIMYCNLFGGGGVATSFC